MGNLFSSTIGSNSAATIFLNATIEQENYAKNSFHRQDLIDYQIASDAIPINVLIALCAEWKNSHNKAICILRSTSAIISFISSSIFIWMIMRSHDRLSTTQHRLFLGLCICDIISSVSQSTFNATAPSEHDYYDWNARGNQATCTAQGFLIFLGIFGGLFYNASLNVYFLSVVKYKKNDEFIRAKIEPFLHGLPIVLALGGGIYYLVKKHFNDNGTGHCVSIVQHLPHCIGYDVWEIREGFEIPCWRGIEGSWTAAIYQMITISIPVLIMMVSLGTIYSSVRTQEKKLAKYGVGALRSNLNLQLRSTSTPQQRTEQDKQSSGIWGRMTISLTALSTSIKSRILSCRKTNKVVTRSNSVRSQSRAVMHKALGYSFAWFLSYGCWLIGAIIDMNGSYPLVLGYLVTIFMPLQGLFNLIIFMYPKIMAAKTSKKRGGETVSWCQAFVNAFWSRGKEGKNQGTSISNLRGHSKRRLPEKTRNEDAASGNVKKPMFGRIKKKKEHRADTPQEEEKCEIQAPDNLNPNKTKAMYSAASTATYARNIVPSSADSKTKRAENPSSAEDMMGMKKVVFAENVNVGNTLSGVVDDPNEELSGVVDDPNEGVMSNQDEEEEMKEIEEGAGNVDRGKDEKQMSLENQVIRNGVTVDTEEMNVDGNCEQVSVNATAGTGEQKEEEA